MTAEFDSPYPLISPMRWYPHQAGGGKRSSYPGWTNRKRTGQQVEARPVVTRQSPAHRESAPRIRLVSSIWQSAGLQNRRGGFEILTGRQNACSSSSAEEQLLRKQKVACSIQAGSTRLFNKEGR